MFNDNCPFHDFDKVHEIGDFPSSKTRITRKNASGKISGILKLDSKIFQLKSRELIFNTSFHHDGYVYAVLCCIFQKANTCFGRSIQVCVSLRFVSKHH